ncbi:MAG: hypothetical protein LT102_02780 [Burkholderiaceae bacterium]|nr:hypothetical protein [Burkholderiaceae bacterium]
MPSLADDFPELLQPREGPCLSLYQATHRRHPDNQQDPIRFRNGVKTLDESLRRQYPNRETRTLLEPFHALAENEAFWNRALDGLAVLAAPGFFRAYRLQRSVPERAIVADSFHLKPLLRMLQSADRYRILGLSRSEAKLYEGNRDSLDEVEWMAGVPRTPADVSGDERDVERATRHYGSPAAGKVTRHGTDVKQDAVDRETERFFRAVDRGVLAEHGGHDASPLLLAALPENHHLFRRVSRNPSLAAAALYSHPDSMPIESLRARAWELVQPYYLERLDGLVGAFEAARARHLASSDLADIGNAVVAGRVATLLIDADRVVPGTFDAQTGAVRFDDLAHPGIDDLLDDLAEAVLRQGGEVVVVPSERMPVPSGAAATYRY